jgi:hypothetical protein
MRGAAEILPGASVDPTDARNTTVRCFSRSDRRAQRHPWLLRSIRPKRCDKLKGIVCIRPPACRVGPKYRPAKPVQSGGANPWGSSPAHLITTLPRPCAAPSVTPKTPPIASGGLGPSHSNPIGDGAVGPRRSGLVLRLWIRKADGAWGGLALVDGLADTRFSRKAHPRQVPRGSLARGTSPTEGSSGHQEPHTYPIRRAAPSCR